MLNEEEDPLLPLAEEGLTGEESSDSSLRTRGFLGWKAVTIESVSDKYKELLAGLMVLKGLTTHAKGKAIFCRPRRSVATRA